MTYDELTRRIGEPQHTGLKIGEDQTLITVFHWKCGCRAYEWPHHIEIAPCLLHREILADSGE